MRVLVFFLLLTAPCFAATIDSYENKASPDAADEYLLETSAGTRNILQSALDSYYTTLFALTGHDHSGTYVETESQTLSFASPNLSISGGNSVDISAIQDGTGTDDQTASEVPITDAGGYYAGSDAETALQEAGADIDTLNTSVYADYLAGTLMSNQVHFHARKGSVGTITKGTPVYITGYNPAGYYEVEPSDIDSDPTFPADGLAEEEITNGADGEVIRFGILENLDTSAWTEGDLLYIASGGGLTSTKPAADAQILATVVRSNPTQGALQVAVIEIMVGTGDGNHVVLDASARLPAVDGSLLTGLTESQITDLSHTVNTNAATICTGTDVYLDGEGNCDTISAGASALNDLSDATVTTPSGSQLLIYDGTDSFDNQAMSGDATIASNGAITIAADAVALGTDTTGNYVAGATANKGLALTGTEGGTLGLIETCGDGEVLKFATGTGNWACGTDATGGGGTPNILDLGNDASSESTDLITIATSGDTNSVFTEPTADKLLITLSNNWPSADTADALSANGSNCAAGSYPLGVDVAGVAEGCTDATTEIDSAISTHTSNADAHYTHGTAADNAETDFESSTSNDFDPDRLLGDTTDDNLIDSAVVKQSVGTNIGADLEEETHASEHASGGGDAVDHDTLTNFVANEHLDWTLASQGTIHATNYVDNTGTDDQTIDVFSLSTDTLSLSLESDGEATKTVVFTNWDRDSTDDATAGGAFHDGFSDFVANEHIDWTQDQGATNIHSGNYDAGIASVSADTAPALGGNLDLNGKAFTREETCGATLSAGDLVYLNSATGKMELTDADVEATTAGFLAVATEGCTDTQTATFLIMGEFTLGSGRTKGATVYVGLTPGDFTDTRPSTIGQFVRIAGYETSATTIFFKPAELWLKVK